MKPAHLVPKISSACRRSMRRRAIEPAVRGLRSLRILGAAPLAIASMLAVGCRTIDDTWGFPPFYEKYPTPSTRTEAPGEETFVRPLYSYETRRDDATRVRSFPPLIDFHKMPGKTHNRLLPLFSYRSFDHETGERDVDWFLFPLFFGGHDPTEGRYFAFFPVGGKLKGLLAHDEITFALLPLYWYWRTGERESTHILFPLFNYVGGGDWKGWRFWPFYGRYRSFTETDELRYDRGFVLWPFYNRQRNQLHDNPTEVFFTFPFYGYKKNRRVEDYTYLWPLYQLHIDKIRDRRIHMGYLFPFRFTDGQTDLWPLFGVKRTTRRSAAGTDPNGVRDRYRHFILWPIERYDWASDQRMEMSRFWLLPLFWRFHYIDKETSATRTEWKLWPLLQCRSMENFEAVDFLSPLWFRQPEYERFYSRWFNIFRYRWRPHVSGWEFLYGAIMYRETRSSTPLSGPGSAEIASTDEAVISILGGLLTYGTRQGKFVFRLAYIPWW